MDIKKTLLEAVTGAGETGKTVVSASRQIIKEGGATVGDLIHIAFEIAQETSQDATGLVRDVVVGAVEATTAAAGTGGAGVGKIISEAEKAAGEITQTGGEEVRQGIAKAKEILQEPLK